MRILNDEFGRALQSREPLRLNLGSGGTLRPGYWGVDLLELPGVDVQADLNRPLDWLPEASVDEVYSRHALEHVEQILPLMRELHRVLKPGGLLRIVVPHFSNPYFYSDLTHRHPFGLYSFFYFCAPGDQPRRKVPCFYVDFRYRVQRLRIRFYRRSLLDRLVVPALDRLVNSSIATQDWYERRLCRLWHASEMEVDLSPVKSG